MRTLFSPKQPVVGAQALASPHHARKILSTQGMRGGTVPSSICFGYQTAFQILRETNPRELVPVLDSRTLSPSLPHHEEIAFAVARLEKAYPGLHLDRPVHVLFGGNARHHATDLRKPHACTHPLPRRSLLRWDDGIVVCAPAHALTQEASIARDEIALLELAWELCGTYQTRRTASRSAYDVAPLASTRIVRDFVTKNPSLDGAQKTLRALRYLADDSASARETKFAITLGLPLARGAYGLGIPRMNYEVITSSAARTISGRARLRCDLCWPDAKLDVEYQSRESHAGEVSRIRDSRRTNALASMGWTVMNVTNDELDSLWTTDVIAETVRKLLGKRLQMRIPDHHARKLKLRRQLGLPVGYE